MASFLEQVDRTTQIVGENRIELLLFGLGYREQLGINVFKVKEIVKCPELHEYPQKHEAIRGLAHMRDETLPVIDLKAIIHHQPAEQIDDAFLILTEYNRTSQGFLVQDVMRMVNLDWAEVHAPPASMGSHCYLTAVAELKNQLIQILDVEKILDEVMPVPKEASSCLVERCKALGSHHHRVLICDDSALAVSYMTKVLSNLGVELTVTKTGKECLECLEDWVDNDPEKLENLAMVVSDIEMPEMDGYVLTTAVRKHPRLANLHIALHTSLSGVFNETMIQKVGADEFLTKFHPDSLTESVLNRLESLIRK